MAKKNWTEEERLAFGAKMKAAREAKRSAPAQVPVTAHNVTETHVEAPGEPQTTISQDDDYNALLARIQELEAAQWRNLNKTPDGATVGPRGVLGTVEKYSTERSLYDNPIERLMLEEKLKKFAFDMNYELQFEVTDSSYETIDGIRQKEPKFTLDLIRVIYDEETGDKTNGRYTVCRLIMHEDPDAAIVIARDNNIVIETDDEKTFLNEMRYLRMRDWLIECFYPAPVKTETNKREMVVNGQLVEYFEVNSENSASVPFDKLNSTKKLR